MSPVLCGWCSLWLGKYEGGTTEEFRLSGRFSAARVLFAHFIRTAGKRRDGFQGFSDRIYRIIRIMKAPNTLAHYENPVNLANPV